MRNQRNNLLAAAWGIAEATVFFIVPDVLLSWFALYGVRRALIACLFAMLGALVGGTIVWFVARNDPESLRQLFTALPAINYEMLSSVRAQLEQDGLVALFLGPLTGTPYKIYTLEAAHLGFGFAIFMLISIPARLIRFVFVTVVVAAVSHLLRLRLTLRQRQYLLAACWIAFYSWYFYAMRDTN